MTVCVPIKDLKDTTAFAETVAEARGPVIVTRNGKDVFVSMSMDEYESMKMEAARSRLAETSGAPSSTSSSSTKPRKRPGTWPPIISLSSKIPSASPRCTRSRPSRAWPRLATERPKPTQSSYKTLPPALSRGESPACSTDNNDVAE